VPTPSSAIPNPNLTPSTPRNSTRWFEFYFRAFLDDFSVEFFPDQHQRRDRHNHRDCRSSRLRRRPGLRATMTFRLMCKPRAFAGKKGIEVSWSQQARLHAFTEFLRSFSVLRPTHATTPTPRPIENINGPAGRRRTPPGGIDYNRNFGTPSLQCVSSRHVDRRQYRRWSAHVCAPIAATCSGSRSRYIYDVYTSYQFHQAPRARSSPAAMPLTQARLWYFKSDGRLQNARALRRPVGTVGVKGSY